MCSGKMNANLCVTFVWPNRMQTSRPENGQKKIPNSKSYGTFLNDSSRNNNIREITILFKKEHSGPLATINSSPKHVIRVYLQNVLVRLLTKSQYLITPWIDYFTTAMVLECRVSVARQTFVNRGVHFKRRAGSSIKPPEQYCINFKHDERIRIEVDQTHWFIAVF